jgi:lysophospholipase L1-like esterase
MTVLRPCTAGSRGRGGRLTRAAAAASVLLLAALALCAQAQLAGAAARTLHVSASVPTREQELLAPVTVRVHAVDQGGRGILRVRCVFSWHVQSKLLRRVSVTNGAGIARATRVTSGAVPGERVSVTVRCSWHGQVARTSTWYVPQPPLPAVPKIVFVGDSITVGMYATSDATTFRGRLEDRVPCYAETIAGSGDQTKDVDLASVRAAAGDIYVIELGTNDANGHPTGVPVKPAVFASRLRTVARAARAGSPSCRLVFLTVWQALAMRRPYDARIAAVAATYGRHLVSIASIKDDLGYRGPPDVRTFLGLSDAWHPNDAGHDAIAARVSATVKRLLRLSDVPTGAPAGPMP